MRYYCHHCHTQIPAEELLPEFTCPSCHSGFIEEMPPVRSGGHSASSRRNSSADDSQRAGSDDGAVSGFISTRMSSDEYSDDNSDVEFLDAVNGPLAQVFGLLQQPHQQQSSTLASTDSNAGQSTQQSAEGAANQQNRRITRSATRLRRNSGQMHNPAYSSQSLADVLNDFITGVSFGTQFTDGPAPSNSQNVQGTSASGQVPANRGLINIDFPLPFFLHSNAADYAWGNAGFDAVITQLLNNLDGSNSGPPPMPKDQIDSLPKVKISDEQVKNTNLQCTVCMDDFQIGDNARQLPCEHFFHQDCILPWLELHASCPICRKTFVSGTTAAPNLDATSPQTEVSNPTANPTSQPGSSATSSNSNTTSTSTTVSNQNVAPSYDYTEDDCD